MGFISDLKDMIRAMREPKEDRNMEAQLAKLDEITLESRGEAVITHPALVSPVGGKSIVPQVKIKPTAGKKGRGKGQTDANEIER